MSREATIKATIMKRTRRFSYLVAGMLMLLTLMLPSTALAAAITLSLSPSQTSVQQGSNFTVTANLSTGSAKILDILATINFDAGAVQYISTSYNPSASWGSPGPEAHEAGAGYKKIDVVKNDTAPSGNLTIATLTFKALAGSGSTNFSISDASSGDADNPPPAVHSVSTNGTTVSFTTAPASPNGNNSQSSTSSGQPSEQEIQANSELDDSAPVPVSGYIDETGYLVDILVLDKDGKPVADTEVTLGDHTATTDSNGVASFTGVKAGKYKAKALGSEQEVNIITGDPALVQGHTITQSKDPNWMRYAIIGAAGLGVILLAVLAWSKLKNGKWGGRGRGQTPENVAYVGGKTPPPSLTTPNNDVTLKNDDQSTVIHPDQKPPA